MQEKGSPTLDYASTRETPSDLRGLATVLLASCALSAVATAWWQVGIRIGQRVEGQNVLFEPATGTDFWDRAVIDPPFVLCLFGFFGIWLWCVLMIHRKRWGGGAAIGAAMGSLLLIVTPFLSIPLIEEASP